MYRTNDILRVIKWLRWVGHVAKIKKCTNAFKILTGKPRRGKDLEQGLGVDGWTMLECILKNKCQYEEFGWFGSE